MLKKHYNRKNVQRFYCFYCDRRLWRLGSPKRFIFHLDALQIQQKFNISRKSAVYLATKGICVDGNSWLEEFCCGEDGKLWMKVVMNTGSDLVGITTSKDYQQSTC